MHSCWEIPSKRQVGWPALAGEEIWSVPCNGRPSPSTALVIEQHCAFEQALAGSRRRYPTHEFRSFAAVVRQYAEATREDEMLHRGVVSAVNGLVQYLQCERKKVPGEVLWEADRLECLLFGGYDPHFDGDEPPGL